MVVEQLDYEINWKAFKRGTSFFIPCLDPIHAKAEIMVPINRLKLKVILKVKIEEGVQGVRVWRL